MWTFKSFHDKSEASWGNLVICYALTQSSVVILVKTTIQNHLKFTCVAKKKTLQITLFNLFTISYNAVRARV